MRDALDQVPLLDGLPPQLVRRIDHVRLYSPNLKFIDLVGARATTSSPPTRRA